MDVENWIKAQTMCENETSMSTESMDVKDRMKVLYNNFFTNTMCENERTAEVKSEFSADMSMDVENQMSMQYDTSYSHTMCDNERTFATNGTTEFSTNKVFKSHQDLKHWVQSLGRSLGYVIVTKRSKKFKTKLSDCLSKVTLMCDRNGISKSTSSGTNRTTKKTNCPFQLVGKYSQMYNFWTLRVICEKHNHEPALDMEGHPYAQRLSDNEYRLVMELLKKDVKPQDILSTLKEKNPNNVSTLQTIYEARKKIRKTSHAETIIGEMANGEASVSRSAPYTPPAFDADKMKQTVDHTKAFASSKLAHGFDSATQGTFAGQGHPHANVIAVPTEDEPTFGRIFQLHRDLVLNKPHGQVFMSDYLEGDHVQGQSAEWKGERVEGGQTNTGIDSDKQDKVQYEGIQSDSDMVENGIQSDANCNGLADICNEMNKTVDIEDGMNSQYNTNFTQTVCENERTYAVKGKSEFSTNMVFRSHQDLKHWVQNLGRSLGYVIVTKSSKKFKTKLSGCSGCLTKVRLMCDRGGIYKSKSSDTNRTTRKINCPFQLVGKYSKTDNFWTLRVICEKHNHEPALDMEGHPYAQRLSDNEYRLVVELLKKDVKPQDILSTLKEKNPNNVSTLQTIYEARKKFRKTRHAETIIGEMANGEASVSRSAPYTPPAFDANKMKQTVDHAKAFASSKLAHGFDSATQGTFAGQGHPHTNVIAVPTEDEPTFGRISQPHRDLVLDKPHGQVFMSDSLEGDHVQGQSAEWKGGLVEGGQTNTGIDSDKQDKVQYEGVQSDSDMVENGLQSDVNFNGLADVWNEMNVGLELNKLVDIEDGMNSQYNTNFTQTECENEKTYAVKGKSEFSTNMVFRSHQDLKHWVQNLGRSLGYVIVTKSSKKFKTKLSGCSGCLTKVRLMCDRGGIYKSKSSDTNRTTRKINCPFELVGKYWKMYNFWTLRVICEKHNHEPALDMEGHPYAQRLSDNEYRLVVELLKKDVKPQDILSTLKEKNPNNVSTLQTIYEARKKIRKTRHAETIIGEMANGEASVPGSALYTPPAFDANKMKQTVDHSKAFTISKLVHGFDSATQGTFAGQVPMPCYKRSSSFQTDLTLTNPVKEISNAYMFMFDDKPEGPFYMKQFLEGDYSLGQSSGVQTNTALESRDVKDKNVSDFEINKKHDTGEYVGVQSGSGMEENESSDANINGFADIWKDLTAGLGSSKSMVVKDRMNTQCDTKSTRANDENERQFPGSSTSEIFTGMIMTGDEARHF